jgi:hypothetical protein
MLHMESWTTYKVLFLESVSCSGRNEIFAMKANIILHFVQDLQFGRKFWKGEIQNFNSKAYME